MRNLTLAVPLLLIAAACGDDYQANPLGKGPAPVPTGSAGDLGSIEGYVILAKTGITNVTGSTVTGNLGLSPAAASFVTGFSLVADGTNVFSTSASVWWARCTRPTTPCRRRPT